MTKIGFITTNKVLGQSLSSAINSKPNLGFEPFILLNLDQAALDVEVLQIDVAVIDILDSVSTQNTSVLSVCKKIRRASPSCRLLLFLSQDDIRGKATAVAAVQGEIADDFVFYDTSLEYFFAKLSAF